MRKKYVFFDLDGTLTDSGEGIIKCAALALEHFGLPVPDGETMREFVGPPLGDTFQRFGVPANKVDEAIAVYRSRYLSVGKFENFPYPGIPQVLKTLQERGYRLFVATSKPEETSVEILEHFGLDKYFDVIAGASFDGARSSKSSVIAYLLSQVAEAESITMVGDTAFDVLGAKAHGIPTIGAAWGYGKVEALEAAGAIAIADNPQALLELLI
ncbi:MAG TPA: HAD-IA family hydrolase [Candidatus Faecousia intestinigallinarum]|nr:HAD-IA family hydrolase [Candidatus Faecousia intestinigallinarum]